MTINKTNSDGAVTLTARDLRDLVTPVLPFAQPAGDLPVLAAVRIQARGEHLTATATDRFRVGICRHKPTQAPTAGLSALVPAAELRRLLTIFKATRFDNPTLILAVSGDSMEVTQGGALAGMLSASVVVRLETAEYPAVESLLLAAATVTPGSDALGFNAAVLADFRHVVRNGDSLVMRPGADASKAVIVTCGDHFIGAVMPKRLVSTVDDTLATWTPLLAPAPAVKKTRGKREQVSA